jgi:ABC-type thiamin/hydroxymethylpyrimidine transport system permease subunit
VVIAKSKQREKSHYFFGAQHPNPRRYVNILINICFSYELLRLRGPFPNAVVLALVSRIARSERVKWEDRMQAREPEVVINYLAIVGAAVASFILEIIWFGYLMRPWLNGLGECSGWYSPHANIQPAIQFGVAFVSQLVIATGVSFVTQLTGAQTALRGIATAACLWFAFVATTWATQYSFELRPWSQLGINGGFWLVGMLAMGAIVGAWRH